MTHCEPRLLPTTPVTCLVEMVVCFEVGAKMVIRAQRARRRGCTCLERVVLGVINESTETLFSPRP